MDCKDADPSRYFDYLVFDPKELSPLAVLNWPVELAKRHMLPGCITRSFSIVLKTHITYRCVIK
jgi:hypothetical protein